MAIQFESSPMVGWTVRENDRGDIEFPILTPNSLLYGRSNIVPELEAHRIESVDLRKRAKHLRRCKETVWRRWRNEYLRGLRERHNQQHGGKLNAPTVGEVVIIKSDEKNRGKWKDRSNREGDSWDRRCYTGRKSTNRDVGTRESGSASISTGIVV